MSSWLIAAALLAMAVQAVSCAPPASEGGFDAPDPASKLYAISRAGRQRDRSAVPRLVEQLDSDDPAVRMMAIRALQNITGTRLGYNPYTSVAERREALERWVQAVKTRQFSGADADPAAADMTPGSSASE